MSLKFFHQVIIFAGFTISLIFSWWCFFSTEAAGSTGYFIAGIVFIFVALGFVGYEIHFLKKTKKLILN